MKRTLLFTWCALLLLPLTVYSQSAYPENEEVQITAADGLTLVGDFFPPTSSQSDGALAILFLHQHGGNRVDVAFLAPLLVDQGYALLSVDLRGHGDTGGEEDWEAVTGDLQLWMDWLQSQPSVRPNEGLITVGLGVGGNYALIACANAANCQTAVAISPLAAGCEVVSCIEELDALERSTETLTYIDTTTTAALSDGLLRRSALLISSQRNITADSAKYLVSISRGDVQANFFGSSAFALEFFTGRLKDRVTNLIVGWMNEHG
jgi:pimeloyl-ACP methyl ester carboxylesterase